MHTDIMDRVTDRVTEGTMAMPIQVWELFLPGSLFDEVFIRDFCRARRLWRGEDRIWLMPYAKEEVVSWDLCIHGRPFGECLIRSERPNIISIFHVDEGRRMYPPLSPPQRGGQRFPAWLSQPPEAWPPTILPPGFYLYWLNAVPQAFEPSERWKQSCVIDVPVVTDGKVAYTKGELRGASHVVISIAGPEASERIIGQVDIGPLLQVDKNDPERFEKERILKLVWPPPGVDTPLLISPEAESRRLYGPAKYKTAIVDGAERSVLVWEKDGEQRDAFHFWLRWPEPFDAFFPTGGDVDLLFHQTRMRQCIEKLQAGQYTHVLQEVEDAVNALTGEAHASCEQAWFLPKVVASADIALLELKGHFQIDVESLAEVEQSAAFQEKVMQNQIPVRWVLGWLGYFWWEFYQDLKDNATIRVCQHPECGNIFRAEDKRQTLCKDPACVRRRNNSRQRKHRARGR